MIPELYDLVVVWFPSAVVGAILFVAASPTVWGTTTSTPFLELYYDFSTSGAYPRYAGDPATFVVAAVISVVALFLLRRCVQLGKLQLRLKINASVEPPRQQISPVDRRPITSQPRARAA